MSTQTQTLYQRCPVCSPAQEGPLQTFDLENATECNVCAGMRFIPHCTIAPPYCENHPILDGIASWLLRRAQRSKRWSQFSRESECVEFTDRAGQKWEIVVRPIDDDYVGDGG